MWTCFWLRSIKIFIQFVLCHESVPDFMTVHEEGKKKRKLTQARLENRKQETKKNYFKF